MSSRVIWFSLAPSIAALLEAWSIKVTLIAYIYGLPYFSIEASIDVSFQNRPSTNNEKK